MVEVAARRVRRRARCPLRRGCSTRGPWPIPWPTNRPLTRPSGTLSRRERVSYRPDSGGRRGGLRGLDLARGHMADHLVDEAVFLGLDGGEVAVALGVLGDALDRLVAVSRQDLVDDLLALDD